MGQVQRLAGFYFALQALAVALWWLLLWTRPEYRAAFSVDPTSDVSLLAFSLPDLVVLAGASIAASIASFRSWIHLIPSLWTVVGAAGYATLYCLAGALMSGSGWLGVLCMVPAALLSLVFAMALSLNTCRLFRRSASGSLSWNLTKTAGEIVLFWGVLLFLVPGLLVELQLRVGLPFCTHPYLPIVGGVLFVLFSALGLWSGFTMVRFGEGTPLPLDAPRRLVIQGPYAYVRNPMAVAGLGQGFAVGMYTGSLLVLGYVMLGALIWHHIVRPLEDADLAASFGSTYSEYEAAVRCWWPRWTPYHPVESLGDRVVEPRRWEAFARLVQKARATCDAEVVETDEGFIATRFEDCLASRNPVWILDELEGISYDNKTSRQFWACLYKAAKLMRLETHIKHYEHILTLYDNSRRKEES